MINRSSKVALMVLVCLGPGWTCLVRAQPQPEVRSTAEDKIRREVSLTQKAFLDAHPNLERDIDKAKPAELRKQIEESQNLAIQYTEAKRKYYELMIELSAAGLERLQAGKPYDPAQTAHQVRANRERREAVELDLKNMRDRVQKLEALAASSPRAQQELEDARSQAAALDAIRRSLVEEGVDLQSLIVKAGATEEGRKTIVAGRKQQVEGYKVLKSIAERQRNGYVDYFGHLKDHVDQREAGTGRGRPKQ